MTDRLQQLNDRAEFGTIKTDTSNYAPVETFVPQFKLWAGVHMRTLDQSSTLAGTRYEDTRILMVQHNPRLTESLLVKFRGVIYTIVSISPDERLGFPRFDLITVKQRTKNGGGRFDELSRSPTEHRDSSDGGDLAQFFGTRGN